jgi:hypothetical protein
MIEHDQTACRCGGLLASCADCRGWLLEHSPRIAHAWRFAFYVWGRPWMRLADQPDADSMEENRLGFFLARRFLDG